MSYHGLGTVCIPGQPCVGSAPPFVPTNLPPATPAVAPAVTPATPVDVKKIALITGAVLVGLWLLTYTPTRYGA